ncbi:hypothetical protein HDF24_13465 [Mucilaginibacter sp. X4EP1]|uniref:hypothetical protein n=1 Tax=Mucilaginibacter sp. X4EP1 TaxID=2723092 RepID=UPI0021674089|nr:hypothetical protein [Mucilaginibacter sp. X4EP1]
MAQKDWSFTNYVISSDNEKTFAICHANYAERIMPNVMHGAKDFSSVPSFEMTKCRKMDDK